MARRKLHWETFFISKSFSCLVDFTFLLPAAAAYTVTFALVATTLTHSNKLTIFEYETM